MCVGVPSAPPIPPSLSEAEKKEYKKISAFRSLLELYKNIPFVLLSIVFSKLQFSLNFYNATIFQQFLLLFLALLQHRLKKYLLILATVNINRQLDMQELLLQLCPLFLFCLEVCGWLTAKLTSEKLTIFQSLLYSVIIDNFSFTAVVITVGSSISLIGFSLVVQFNFNFYLACVFYGLLT